MTLEANLTETDVSAVCPQTSGRCKHCNGSVRNSGDLFCCRGCELVHHTLLNLGLSGFYRMLRAGETLPPAAQSGQEKDYRYLDEREVQARILRPATGAHRSVCFYLPTIHCAACVWLLERLPQFIPGVLSARVGFGAGRLDLTFDPAALPLSKLAAVLSSIGYPPVPYTPNAVDEEDRREERALLRRIGVAALCAANTMMLAVSLFQGYFTGMEEPYGTLFRWLSAALALPAVCYCAVPFYRTAVASLFCGTLHIDLPISIAILSATGAGFVSLWTGREYLYFDSVTALIFLLLLGRYLQRRAIHRARASVATTWDLLPSEARCIVDGRAFMKPLRELCVGDVIEVLAGERFPADGRVTLGASSVETKFLTGESVPQLVTPGGEVLGGTLNVDGRVRVAVTSVGDSTRLQKLLVSLADSQSEKAALENAVNGLSSYFVFGVLILAAFTYAGWSFIDPARAFDCMVAMLIVTCPCVLGLAIPAAVTVSLARAQRSGLFVKRADALERLAASEHVYFDKTGTLTDGKLSVTRSLIAPDERARFASLARFGRSHPAAAAVAEHLAECGEVPLDAPVVVPGRGCRGHFAGSTYRLGSVRWLREEGVMLFADPAIDEALASGASILGAAHGDRMCGYFILEDRIRDAAYQLVSDLHAMNVQVFILSGDLGSVVRSVGSKLGIPPERCRGELLPAEKSALVSADTAVTTFVGDGINDALALRAATTGVGLRGGLEATLESADIFVGSDNIRGFERAFRGARRTRAVILRNLSFAVFYNLLGAGAAAAGFVTPLTAAILMPASSLTVVLSSVTARYFED